jgi:CRISPR-associated endoribonuclease Cas6
MRIHVDLSGAPQILRYTDSMNAAIVAGLTAAGLTSEEVTGAKALPWTFALHRTPGRTRVRNRGELHVSGVTISSPSDRIAEALLRIEPADISVTSSNGDRICCAGGLVLREEPEILPDGMTVSFASPVLLMRKKEGSEKTVWADAPDQVDVGAALHRGLSNRAGRELDLRISPAEGGYAERLFVPLRHDARRGLDVLMPAFRLPLRVEGAAEDLRFAYLAGFGAKTRAGFGCPALMN